LGKCVHTRPRATHRGRTPGRVRHGHPDHLVGTQAQGFVPDRWLAAGPFLTRVLVPVSGS